MDVDTLTERFSEQADEAGQLVNDRLNRLRAELPGQVEGLRDRTARAVAPAPLTTPSWGQRLLWLGLGALVGAGVAYLADPDRGHDRREYLGARGRELAEGATQKADYVAGEAKGAVVEGAKTATPQDVPSDPKVLRQRIRSDVFGQRDDVDDVVLRIDGPGQVALKGTVPTPSAERSLIEQVSKVEGVKDVQSELAHATG